MGARWASSLGRLGGRCFPPLSDSQDEAWQCLICALSTWNWDLAVSQSVVPAWAWVSFLHPCTVHSLHRVCRTVECFPRLHTAGIVVADGVQGSRQRFFDHLGVAHLGHLELAELLVRRGVVEGADVRCT